MANGYINDFTPTVKTYYKELTKCKPISKDEESNLMIRAKNNDLNAKNKILSSNLRFVFDVAKRYKGYGVPMDDLISEGNLGLIHAFDKFDEKKGYKFISYAVWWINFYIKNFIEKRKNIELHEVSSDDLLPTNPSNITPQEQEDTDDNTFGIDITNEEDIEETEVADEQREIVERLLGKLDIRERQILQYCFGIGNKKPLTLKECGCLLGISQERVRQVKEKSLLKLKSEALLLS